MKITSLPIYHTLCKVMPAQEALKQLRIVINYANAKTRFDKKDKYLGSCFLWTHTPQGQKYWSARDTELR